MPAISDLFPFGDIDDDVVAVAAELFPEVSAPDLSAGFALGKAVVGMLEAMAGVLDGAGMSPARWRVMMALVLQSPPEGSTIGNLAEHLGVREPTVTATVQRLEAEGLIARDRSNEDRRVVRITPTERGLETVVRLVPHVAGRMAEFVTGLGGPQSTRDIADRLSAAGLHLEEPNP